MKAKWGKYKAQEVDAFLEKLYQDQDRQTSEWNRRLEALMQDNQKLKERVTEMEGKERLIAKVMVDATMRAKDIEDNYKERAYESDIAYSRLNTEWEGNLQGCKNNIDQIRREAANLLLQIDEQFEQLTQWSDAKLTALQSMQVPQLEQFAENTPYATGGQGGRTPFSEKKMADREETHEQPAEDMADQFTAPPVTDIASPVSQKSEAVPQEVTAQQYAEAPEPEQPAETALQAAAPPEETVPAPEQAAITAPQAAAEQSAEAASNAVLPQQTGEPPAAQTGEQRVTGVELEREIAKGISADLKALCAELGLFDEEEK